MTKALLRYGLVLLALLLGVSAAAAQDDIDLPLPEIPPGQEVTVRGRRDGDRIEAEDVELP